MSEVLTKPAVNKNPVDIAKAQYLSWLRENDSPMHFFFYGRIESVTPFQPESGKKVYRHEIVTSGGDEFSAPNKFVVSMPEKAGAAGDSISGVCRAKFWFGRSQRSKYADEDGEFKTWKPSNFALQVVTLFD